MFGKTLRVKAVFAVIAYLHRFWRNRKLTLLALDIELIGWTRPEDEMLVVTIVAEGIFACGTPNIVLGIQFNRAFAARCVLRRFV